MPGSAQIGNLAVNLVMETAAFVTGASKARGEAKAFEKSLSGLGSTMKGFAGGLVGGLGIGLAASALGGLAANAIKAGSDLAESSEKVGVSVEALQELNLAAEQSGVSQESLAGAVAKLNRSMGDLQQGKKAAVDAFAAIGLSADDLKGKTPDQALRLIADALNKLPDVQSRVAVGAQIMGRGFSELLPLINGGSKALDDYAQKSRNQGQITTEEAKRLDELADSWARLKVTLGVAAAKIIAMFAELSSKMDDWLINHWYPARDGAVAAMRDMASRAVAAVSGMVSGIYQAITVRLNAVWEGAKAKIDSVKQKFAEMYDAVVGHSYVPDMVTGIAYEFAQLGRIMVDPTVSATDKVAAAFQGLQSALSQILGRKTAGIFSMITGMVSAFAPLLGGLFGGGGAPSMSSSLGADNAALDALGVPGFANGGSGTFRGLGGVDKNVLSMNGSPIAKVSKGEAFKVGAANDGGRIVLELRDEMLDARIASGADVRIIHAYPGIRAGAMQAVGERGRRR